VTLSCLLVGDSPPTQESTPLLEEVLERVDNEVAGPRKELISAFARAYLRRFPDDVKVSADALFAEIAGLFEFVETRADDMAVRVFNPTVASHGYESSGTVIEVNIDDSPFLIDSITNEVSAHGLEVARVMHPVIGTVRDDSGHLTEVKGARQALTRESVQHYVLDRRLFNGDLPGLERAIHNVLTDVRGAVRDFRPMLDRIPRMIDLVRSGYGHFADTEVDEAIAFLEWLRENNYVFLGYREYRVVDLAAGPAVQVVPESGLGILSDDGESTLSEPRPLSSMPAEVAERYTRGELLVITKTNRYSTVHRRAKMDYVSVRILGPGGETVGEARMLGLFTSKAYMEPSSRTPLLRRKLRQILTAEDLIEGSHDHKAVVGLFDGFPKDELFSAPTEDIRHSVMGLLALEERQQVKLFIRRDLLERSVSVLVALPRDRFNANLRKQLQELFKRRFHGSSVDYHLALGESDPAQIHFTVWVDTGQIPDVAYEDILSEVESLTRSWSERVREVLLRRHGEDAARRLTERWANRFPEYYRTSTSLEIAASDIEHLDKLAESDHRFLVGCHNDTESEERLTRVSLYRKDGKRPLSEIVPALEDAGFQVIEEVPTGIDGPGNLFIHDFGILGPDGTSIDLDACSSRLVDALTAIWGDQSESDSLNRLLVTADLDHHQVEILRAYRTYWRRVGQSFTVAYVNDTLVKHAGITSSLIKLFELRFDPGKDGSGYEELRSRVVDALDAVPSLDQDRILRGFLRLIEATLRTNAYRSDRSALALKLDSMGVPDMPRPYPYREIFVLAKEVEGIHLRGGPVARGGIRWSDRREDYRTEVLGLMKAQMTKNAVIVPTGAKGGFVLRRPPSDAAEAREAVKDAYTIFIRGLLDVTDNLEDGRIVHPPGVKIHDGDDAYLVVAADKGTATFSDIANEVARDYGFWLDDAFASGGSTGYDHKALGITARGAWKSLERHFLELGIDPHREPFTAVGIGDMSGDVFGNGMLGSASIKLVAAFDHRHIFLDPDPGAEQSYGERKRLFELPTSSWADYQPELISEGGGVYPRSAKSIDLSEQVRHALGTDVESATPAELIKLILKAPVDLFWNGGIGTYVKASSETPDDVGDKANDAVRVDGKDLRCKVVVEGGNLGFTQRGRIEFADSGGRINTDFIDNSGGVDCSDREVNLKILLSFAERRGEITHDERNGLIASVAEDVVQRILYDNFEQAQMLSQEEHTSAPRMDAYEQLMVGLEADGLLDRAIEGLPSSDEVAERSKAEHGLSRPELAVLLAYAKRSLTDALLKSNLPDSRYLLTDLEAYFPRAISARFSGRLEDHPLRRELISTLAANNVINSVGSTFVSRLVARTGAEPSDVVRAYRIARDIAGGVTRWRSVEELFGKIDQEVWTELMEGADWLIATLARWYLSRYPAVDLGDEVAERAGDFQKLAEMLPSLGPPEWARGREERALGLVERGVPLDIARRHTFRGGLVYAPDILELARGSGRSLEDIGRIFFLLGQAMRLDHMERVLRSADVVNPWQRWAVQTLEDDLMSVRRLLAERVISEAESRGAEKAVDHFLAERSHRVARLVKFSQSLETEKLEDLAPLMVAVKQVRSLAN